MRLTLRHTVRQSHWLTVTQRHDLDMHLFGLRLDLVGRLRDEQYQPRAQCSRCHSRLTPEQILAGFLPIPTDFTTKCPKCEFRFEPQLISFGKAGDISLPFFCDCQVLEMLPALRDLSPEEMNRREPAIYRSAIIHHGGLREAFGKVGIDYPHESVHGWEHIVMPFLGRLTDVTIAGAAGVPVNAVRRLRRTHGIAAFRRSRAAEEAGVC